jgi:hypothetical protein
MNPDALAGLARARFAYLFAEYGFVAARARETHEGHYRGSEVVFVGPMAIAFLCQEPSTAAVGLAPPEEGHKEPSGWVDARRFLDFISKKPLRWKPPYQAGTNYVEAVFSGLADELRPHMPKILEMFRDAKEVSSWKPRFDEYVRSEVERQYHVPKGEAS